MRIGLLAPIGSSVPPRGYGPIEQCVDILARGLVDRGHSVVLWASGDSTSPVELRFSVPSANRHRTDLESPATDPRRDLLLAEGDEIELRRADIDSPCGDDALTTAVFANHSRSAWHVQHAYREAHDVDLLHDQTLVGPLLAAARSTPPVVVTWHAPFGSSAEYDRIYSAVVGTLPSIFLSAAQANGSPALGTHRIIGNSIEIENFPAGAGDGDYFLFLGRMSPRKGAHQAIAAAKFAGVPLMIAGPCASPEDTEYFESAIRPALDADRQYVGPVYGVEKVALLGAARALVVPVDVDEAFGLVVAESLTCGTPVLAFPRGAIPELIEDGVTGRLCTDVHELATAMRDVGRLSRNACRRTALERFSPDRFIDEHLSYYEAILEGRT